MTRAIVTGAKGFIGAAVAKALRAAEHEVVEVGTSATSDPLNADRIYSLGSFDLLVHCAGGSSVSASVESPQAEFAKTVPPFTMLMDHVRRHSPAARVVLLSSAAVYGDATDRPTRENSPTDPVSPYGVHKRMCELSCHAYGTMYGISSIVLRLFSVYGAGLRKQLLWDAAQKARRRDLAFSGTGDETRDWLHVDDAASLVLAAAPHASRSVPIVNGASGRGVTVRYVLETLLHELGAGAPSFSGTARLGDPRHYCADISAARAFGWEPRVELARGIAEYAAWFREQT
jgi:UDP-glucose 4-epimerase